MQEGINLLDSIENSIKIFKPDLKNILYLFKAFAYMAINDFQNAKILYEKSDNLFKLDDSNTFNKLICEGSIEILNKKFDSASELLEKAILLNPESKNGYLFKAILFIWQYLFGKNNTLEILEKAISEFNKSLEKSRKDAELYFCKAVLNLSQNKFAECYQDFSKTLKYADENLARHYFFRGLSAACAGMLKEAIIDIDVALSLDIDYYDAYLVKGKCAYLAGDVNAALSCMQELVSRNKSESSVYVHLGNLMMLNGTFEEALKMFQTSLKIRDNPCARYQLTKCLILIGSVEKAVEELEKTVSQYKIPVMTRDYLSLRNIQERMSGERITEFKENENFFTEMLAQLDSNTGGEAQYFDWKNVKIKGGKDDYCKIDAESVYLFPIFEAEDWLAYRNVIKIYLEKYDEALEDMKKLYKILVLRKSAYFGSDKEIGMSESFSEEINELRFSPVTLNECKFDNMLVYLLVFLKRS